MSKERVNYHSSGTIVSRRSPAGKVIQKNKGKILGPRSFSDSVAHNIDTLNKVLKESDKIMPRPTRMFRNA
ncbi:hypothetical protein [Cytobacillus praedii]|jgi:hypothetical protein|uniref:hypothetical protein n=1 Tax=Cytobacillus praedii TaxID=1742358 RepID=UPI002E1A54BE|nr:hypothetical protein [Cytobacillus praedii]